jgi:2-keto-4-pentenoate hydratase/2-oxohepta-3-ene-1,7-dioic acid hydratase in catechol pathway
MILLSAVTSAGARLAVKTKAGISILESASSGKDGLPLTLEEALLTPNGLNQVRDFVVKNEGPLNKIAKPEAETKLGPLFTPRNVICIGLNYKDHAAEGGVPLPEKPVVFAKLNGCVIGSNAPIILPPDTKQVDYEAELAVVIGRRCKGTSEADALNYVAGYTCMNDVSARDFQFGDNQWVRAKSQDTFGPMGPYLVTSEDIPDPQTLPIRCVVNGQVLQDSNTDKMIFGVRYLISFISRGITLEPGDVISTGTPHGVGFARKPPIFLQDGDEVVVEIDGIGRLLNPVKAA